MVAYAIWATNSKSEVKFYLWGCLEAVVASEANFPSLLGTSKIYEADLYFEYLAYALR